MGLLQFEAAHGNPSEAEWEEFVMEVEEVE